MPIHVGMYTMFIILQYGHKIYTIEKLSFIKLIDVNN